MLKRLLVGVGLALLSFSALAVDPLPKLGGNHLNLGGGVITTIPDTNGLATLRADLSSNFLVTNGRTNTALSVTNTGAKDGQVMTVILANTGPTNCFVTFQDTGAIYYVPSNHIQVVEMIYSAGTASFYTKQFPSQNGGIVTRSNSVAAWPAAAPFIGASLMIQSNHVVYILTSSPSSTSWSATNKIAP